MRIMERGTDYLKAFLLMYEKEEKAYPMSKFRIEEEAGSRKLMHEDSLMAVENGGSVAIVVKSPSMEDIEWLHEHDIESQILTAMNNFSNWAKDHPMEEGFEYSDLLSHIRKMVEIYGERKPKYDDKLYSIGMVTADDVSGWWDKKLIEYIKELEEKGNVFLITWDGVKPLFLYGDAEMRLAPTTKVPDPVDLVWMIDKDNQAKLHATCDNLYLECVERLKRS